jgi:hypothetical protein
MDRVAPPRHRLHGSRVHAGGRCDALGRWRSGTGPGAQGALLALLLAALGIYGVLSYAVAQRTNEIGVRMALGATSMGIMFAFGRRGLGVTLTGLVIGVVLSAIASRLMTTSIR